MSETDTFPLFYPGELRPALSSDPQLRRVIRECQVERTGRVLVLGGADSSVPRLLARELGCPVTVVDASDAALDKLRSELGGLAGSERVQLRKSPLSAPAVEQGAFAAAFVDARAPMPLGKVLKLVRPYLAPKGRVAVVYPVKVGRFPHPASLAFWEKRLGEPLMLPREALQILQREGYEPQLCEALPDAQLDSFYNAVEEKLPIVPASDPRAAQLREEIALHRSQSGRATVSFAILIGRRREPGEKPPPARAE